jgi:hypothetical protein
VHLIYARFNGEADIRALAEYVQARYDRVEWGSQCDDWLWVHFDEGKLEIDTFYTMQLIVHGPAELRQEAATLVDYIMQRYELTVLDPPEEALWT